MVEESLQGDLTPDQSDKLAQLQGLTGIEDLEVCRSLLESVSWNLSEATDNYFNWDSPESLTSSASSSREDNQIINEETSLATYAFYPLQLSMRIIGYFFSFFVSSISEFFSPVSRNPKADVERFINDFRVFGSATNLSFLKSSYNEVLEKAKKDLKFLLVYLHSPKHPDTPDFCKNSLLSEEFLNFLEIKKDEILLWGCSVESGEGSRVSLAARECSYPFIGLVVLRQNRMMIVGRIEESMSGSDLVSRLETFIADNEAYIVAARADRQERNLTQELRQEQDAAFQESLRLDQERERKKKEEEERLKEEIASKEREEKEEADKTLRISRLKVDLVDQLPPEPDFDNPRVLRILIKLPTGTRLERRFLPEDSLKILFIYVFCHPESPNWFDITTNFPRKVLKCRPTFIDSIVEKNESPDSLDSDEYIMTFSEADIGKNTVLFVTDLDA